MSYRGVVSILYHTWSLLVFIYTEFEFLCFLMVLRYPSWWCQSAFLLCRELVSMICYIVFDVMSCFGHDKARSVILSTRLGCICTTIMMVVLSLMHSVILSRNLNGLWFLVALLLIYFGIDDYDFRLWICDCFILTLCWIFLMFQLVMFDLICICSMWNVAVITVFITYFNIIVNKVRIHYW